MMGVRRQVQSVTGSGAMDYTFTPGKEFVLTEVRIHLSAASATAENFVIAVDSPKGSEYDVVLYSRDMNTVQDLVYQPDPRHGFAAGESLKFTWTNTNARTYAMEIIYKAAD